MPFKSPESLEECIYFTNRPLGEKGSVLAWVYRKECPKCHKAKMGKPVEKGKVKTRAAFYQCPNCGYQEEKKSHEESLKIEAQLTCPECGKEGEATTEYKRKNFKGIPSYVITCPHCGANIPLTKKLKGFKGEADVETSGED